MATLQTTLVSGNLNVTSSLAVTGSTTFLSNVSGTTAQFTNLTASAISASGPSVIDVSSSSTALRITQRGTGESFRVEDSENPDSTPFILTNDGRVGIRTTPTALLEVNGGQLNANSTAVEIIANSLRSNAGRLVISTELNTYGVAMISQLTNGIDGGLDFQYITRSTGATESTPLKIRGNGRVGIGLNADEPVNPLHVKGSGEIVKIQSTGSIGNNYLSFRGPSANLGYIGYTSSVNNHLSISNEATSSDIALLTSGSERIRITSTGNVGIGTSSPTSLLHVNGNTLVSGNLNVTGSLTVTGSATFLDVLQGVELAGGSRRAPYIRSAETALNQLQAPLYSFVNNTNTGLTSTDADTITLVTSGSGRLHIDTTAVFALLPHRGTNGSAAAPAYSFTAATGSGMWRNAKNLIFATDGESILSLNQNAVGNQVQAVPTGSEGRPAYTWLDDTQTGFFYDATGTYIGLTVAGTRRALFDTFGVTSGIVGGPTIKWSAGTAASPTYGFFADSETGMYSPSIDQISFVTSGSDRVRIDNNGKVGIGTTAPSKRLHINNSGLLIDGTNTIESSPLAARLIVDSGASTGHTLADFRNSGGSTLFVGGTNVGIGTTTPGARLEVNFAGASSTTEYAAEFKSSGGTTNAGRVLFSQDSTFAMAIAPAATSLSTGRIDFQYITRSTGVVSTTPLSVRGDGRIGIGTTAPSFQLQLSTDSAAKPSTNTWTISSDIRIKENVQNYTKGLETLVQINPVTYDYNGKGGFNPDIKNNVGLIAQDIKDILPESISVYKTKLNPEDTEDTELYNFNSHALTYVMINCIKQLSSEVNTLKAKIDMLSAEVADLKNNQ
jgi:hypothetical protein